MSIFKPAIFRDIPNREDPIRQTADSLHFRQAQIGYDLLTEKLYPYEITKVDKSTEGSMSQHKWQLLRTAQSADGPIYNTGFP